jgi:hypothetical protein
MRERSIIACGTLVLASLAAIPALAQVCDGSVNDTAALQAAVDALPVVYLEPGRTYCVDGHLGVNLPSNVRLYLSGATVGMNPGCSQQGFVCRIFNTRTQTTGAAIEGPGVIAGDLTPACATCYSILVRIDSSVATLRRLTLQDSRSDLVWVGGNQKSTATLDEVLGQRAGRNLVSVVNASDLLIVRSTLRTAVPGMVVGASNPRPNPGACVDLEPNPGDSVDRAAILWSRMEDCETGIYHQRGQGLQAHGFVAAWNVLSGNRALGLTINGVIGAAVFENQIFSAPWSGTGTVPLAGTIAGSTTSTMASDIVFAGNQVTGTIHNAGTPQQVVTGDFRLAGARNTTLLGNLFVNGKVTQAALGVAGDDVKLRNEVRP